MGSFTRVMAANEDAALRLLFDEVDFNKDGLISGMEWLKGFSGKRAAALKPLLQPFRDPETWRELNLQGEQEYDFDQFKQAMAAAAPKVENPLGGEFEQAACASPTNTQGSPAEGLANADADAQVEGATVTPGRIKAEKMIPPGSMSEDNYHTATEHVINYHTAREHVIRRHC